MLTAERLTKTWPRPLHPAVAIALAVVALTVGCAPKGEALYTRAQQSLNQGEVGAAVIDLKNLVDAEPQNAKARALFAEAALQSGDIQVAQVEIRKAKDLGAAAAITIGTECRLMAVLGQSERVLTDCVPDKAPPEARSSVLVARGQAQMLLQRPTDAKAEYDAAAKAEPGNLEALLGQASAVYEISGLGAARGVLEGAGAAAKERPRYWLAVGHLNGVGGDYPAAEKAFSTALEKARKTGASNDKIAALVGLGEAQLRLAKVKDAEETGDQLAKAAPDNPYVKVMRAQIMAAAGDLENARVLLEDVVAKQPANSQARILLGKVYTRQGQFGQAEMNFAAVTANDPGDVYAQRLLAETRSHLQSPQKALESLKPALERNPDPSLLAMAGRLSLQSGDRSHAVAYFSQATSRQGVQTTPQVQLEIASGFLKAGEFDRAIDLLHGMPRSTSISSGYQREYLLISALLGKGDKEGAIAEAKALLESSGNDASVRNLVAAAYTAAGQPGAGRDQLELALKQKPGDVDTLMNLARLDLADGRTADALNGFTKVLGIDPKNLDATTGAAMAAGAGGDKAGAEKWLLKATADHPDSLPAKMALVRFYLATGSFAKAQAIVDQEAKKAPDNAMLANMRGMLLLNAKDGPGAIKSFGDAVRLDPKQPEYVMNLARARLVTGDPKGALATMDEFLADNPSNVDALQLAAALALKGHEVERAAGYVERLRQAAPDMPATDRLDGDLAMAQKRYKDALQSYRKAGDKGKDSELVLAEYSAAKLSGAADAEQVVENWVALHPEDARAVVIVAESRRAAGNRDAAIELYERAIAKSPKDPVLPNNLAVLYQEKHDPRAVETGQRAYNLAPHAAPIMDTYAWILVDAGRLDEAVRLLEQAARALPDLGEVQYHYAVALAKTGKTEQALPPLRKALAGDLPPAVRTDAQKLLKQLSK